MTCKRLVDLHALRTLAVGSAVLLTALPSAAQTRWTPRDWNSRLENWNRDLNANFIEDDLETDPGPTVNVVLDLNDCPDDDDLLRLGAFGTLGYVGKYITVVQLSDVPLGNLLPLANDAIVAMVERDRLVELGLDDSVAAMQVAASTDYSPATVADKYPWLDGSGITIAIVDTGVDDGVHESLPVSKFVGGFDTTICNAANPDDTDGHGTFVASIALGIGDSDGDLVGVAPGANLVDCYLYGSSTCATLATLEWVIESREALSIDVVNLSISAITHPSDGRDSISQCVNRAVHAGLVVVTCVGNLGIEFISTPGAADDAITVGNMDDMNSVTRTDDLISSCSSRGPRMSDGDSSSEDELKPDVCAPGTLIRGAQSGTKDLWYPASGCSLAAPHVAGLAALILQQQPDATPATVKQLLIETAEDYGTAGWDAAYGHGYVDGFAAIDLLATSQKTDVGFSENTSDPEPDKWSSNNLWCEDGNIQAGQANTLFVEVENNGPYTATDIKVKVGVYSLSNSTVTDTIDEQIIDSLPSGVSTTLSVSWTPKEKSGGSYEACIKAEVIYTRDSDFSNNCAIRNVDVKQTASPAVFPIQIHNTLGQDVVVDLVPTVSPPGAPWSVTFSADNFALGKLDCPQTVDAILTALAPDAPPVRVDVAIRGVIDQQPFPMGGATLFAQTPTILDCNQNNIHDWIDILDGSEKDEDLDGVPDSCTLGVCGESGVVINEIRTDQLAPADPDEYFELKGQPGTSLNCLAYVVLGPDGVIEEVVSLNGLTIGGTGLFLVGESNPIPFFGVAPDLVTPLNFVDGGNRTHLLVCSCGLSDADEGTDLDLDDNGALEFTLWASVVDCIALINDVYRPYYCGVRRGPTPAGAAPPHVFRCEPLNFWFSGPLSLPLGLDTPGMINEPCPAPSPSPSTVFGVPVSTIGLAQMTIEPSQVVRLSNIGSSGLDGISFDVGESETALASLLLPNASTLAEGAGFRCRGFDDVNDPGTAYGAEIGMEVVNGQFRVVGDFAPLGGTQMRIQLRDDGEVIDDRPVFMLPDIVIFEWPTFVCQVRPIPCFASSNEHFSLLNFEDNLDVEIDGELFSVDEIRVVVENAMLPDHVARIDVLGSGLDLDFDDVLFGLNGFLHRSNDIMNGVSLTDGEVHVIPLDDPATEYGVDFLMDGQFELSELPLEFFRLRWADLDAAPLADGSYVKVQSRGRIGGVDGAILGVTTATRTSPSLVTLSADYSSIGAGQVIVQALLGNTVVREVQGLVPGIGGSVATAMIALPEGCEKGDNEVVVDDVIVSWPCYIWDWDSPIDITINGDIGPVLADRLAIIAQAPTAGDFESLSLFEPRTFGPAELVIVEATSVKELPCPGDLDGDRDVDLSDLGTMLSDYGCNAGPGNCPGDTDGDGDTDLSDLGSLLSAYGLPCP